MTAGALGLAVALVGTPQGQAAPRDLPEPVQASSPGRGQAIPGQYIVTFRPGTPGATALAHRLVRENGGEVLFTYESAIQGFAARLSEHALAGIRRNPSVVSIEQDALAEAADTQAGATWGLDRTDQRLLPLDGQYTDGNEGAGVHAYVIDTGILLGHTQFTGRVGNGFDAVTAGGTATDCNGHGTHVAGTVGGSTYGMADKVTLHPVRVLSCAGSGSNSGVIAGVDWVRANRIKPAVANMSLGGSASTALDTAVNNAIAAGVTFVVAAGNESTNACNGSPSRVPAAVTVGATTRTDARSSFSNYGSCLDLFAPGSSITSAWHTSTTATNTISGTSMASPHVAGAAALYLSANPTASPQAVRDALVAAGTVGRVSNPGTGSPNVLVYNGFPSAPPPPTSGSIVNGGFESAVGWTQSPANILATNKPRTGSYSAWLGGYNNASDLVEQTVTVPTTGNALTYWWHLTSSESTSVAYDWMYVRVYSTSGSLLATLRSRSNTAVRNAWTSDSLSLAAYAGQTVKLRFSMTTDSSVTSSFFVDDVALQ